MGGMGSMGGGSGGNFGGGYQQVAADIGKGLSTGWATGSGVAQAQYNAAAMRQQAKSLDRQTELQAYLIRKQYESDYRQLLERQTQQQSMNRVVAMKRGITGASAVAVLSSYAAKNRQNLQQLYYNAAMQTGVIAMQNSSRASALRERARQYDWQATATLIGGALNLATGFFDTQIVQAKGTGASPVSQVDSAELAVSMAEAIPGMSDKIQGSRGTIMGAAMDNSNYLPSLR